MRLAGAFHIHLENGANQTKIVNESGKRYTFNELRGLIPVFSVERESRVSRDLQKNSPGSSVHSLKAANSTPPWKHLNNLKTFSIPLEMLLSRGSKELLEGVGEFSRNVSGAKLIRDLLACEEFLCNHGLEPEIGAEEMLEAFCDSCEPQIDDKERETILGSAERQSDLTMSRDDEVIHFEAIWKEIKRQIAHSVYDRINWLTGFIEFPAENLTEYDTAGLYLALHAGYRDYSDKMKHYPNITPAALEGIAKGELGKICKLIERGELSYLEVSTLYPGYIFQSVFKKEDSIKYDRASLAGKFGTRLRYNAYKLRQEIDEKPFIDENIEVSLNSDFNFKFSSKGVDRLQGIFDKAARENAYEPIRDYLFSCPKLDSEILNGLADRLFGCGDEPMFNIYLTKWLLSLVARALIPGSKVDTVLILKGSQGDLKSSFFRILAGEDNFCDSFGEDLTKDKDELAKLSSNWIIEMPEIEELFRKKDYESFKRFITIQVDKIRLPYARKGIESARRSAFGGTANGDQFLNDPTGSRRFWVIPTDTQLDVKWLRENRDEIWGAVLRLFVEMFPDWETRRNETNPEEYIWWLTPIEQAWSNSSNKSYESTDAWEDTILSAAEKWGNFRVQDIAIHALNIDIKSVDKKTEMRICDVLKGTSKNRLKKVL
jgi:Virulence-associated protein E